MSVTSEVAKAEAPAKEHYEIYVGDIKESWDRPLIVAKEIIRAAGFKEPEKFVLEALDKRGGAPAAEFEPDAAVDLAMKDRKFFRVTPGGGGRS
jgi:hypothetical protein